MHANASVAFAMPQVQQHLHCGVVVINETLLNLVKQLENEQQITLRHEHTTQKKMDRYTYAIMPEITRVDDGCRRRTFIERREQRRDELCC